MKVALINPGKNLEYADNEPLSLGYLASQLELNNCDVKIIDQLSGDDVRTEIDKFTPDIVGATSTTPVVKDAYAILEFAKSKGCKTVIGGVHASVMTEEASKYADYVVVGEGENAILEIVNGNVKEKIVKFGYIKNIDEISPPARHLMNMDFYIKRKNRIPTAHLYFLPKNTRLASMITSRGCPYNCTFCHNSWRGIPVRYHSPNRVIDELTHLKERYGVGAIFFMDDDFFINKTRLKTICEEIINRKIAIIWSANARVSSVNMESLEIARLAGCKQINFGIESGSQRILDVLNKKTTVEQSTNAVRMAKKAGMYVYATFMLGNPTETLNDIGLTKNFILKNNIDSIGIGITTPYPGTKIWEWCKSRSLIPGSIDWNEFNMESCPVPANDVFSKKEIEKIRSRIIVDIFFKRKLKFLMFYLKAMSEHPVILFDKMSKVVSPLLKKLNEKKN